MLLANPALAKMLSYETVEDLLAVNMAEDVICDPEHCRRLLESIAGVRDAEVQRKHQDGRVISVQMNGRAVPDRCAAVLEAEEMIARQARVIESSSEFIALASPAGEMLYLNPAGRKLVGLGPDEDISRLQVDDFTFREDASLVAEVVTGLLQNKSWEGEFRFRHFVSGQPISVYQYAFTLSNSATGEVSALASISHDVTEQKKLQAQFEQAQKLEAVGRLVGGIAHDFGNLLAVITGYSELAMNRLESAHPAMRSVSQIKEAAERAANLTQQLLTFSRQQVVAPRVIDLNAVVSKSSEMLKRLVSEDVHIIVAPGAHPGLIKADPGQMEQILVNLVVNARDAMPKGGEIAITTANADLDDPYAREHPELVAGRYVLLSVRDTGIGIDEKIMPHIFEPFFTTKPVGRGTGLGLATVYGIVKQSQGNIWVHSELNHGTTFKIYFPRVPEHSAGTEAEPALSSARGAETILLVEDEAELRMVTATLLEDHGYKVLPSGSGAAALDLVQTQSGKIDLLLTDVIMPNMAGPELFAQLQNVRPGIRVLYMSGYAGDQLECYGRIDPYTELLEKPFAKASLLKKVRAALDR